MFQVVSKLKLLKKELKSLNRSEFANIQQRAQDAKAQLLDCQEFNRSNPSSADWNSEKQLFKKFYILSAAEKSFLK